MVPTPKFLISNHVIIKKAKINNMMYKFQNKLGVFFFFIYHMKNSHKGGFSFQNVKCGLVRMLFYREFESLSQGLIKGA